ncbi:MAG: glycosyltransferase [Alphaproteobacteria bacterium]|nr:glycosyltransferase [Alphaproteobacteria bacterium]
MTQILYVGSLDRNGHCYQRMQAFRRLGWDVEPFDTDPYVLAGGRIARAIRIRLLIGPEVERMNVDLLAAARARRYDHVWLDKVLFLRASTVRDIAATGARTIHFNPDNPFGSRGDPGWRLFMAAIPSYDVHVLPRASNIAEYTRAGARRCLLMPYGYDPETHFPPPAGWRDSDRTIDVGFVGTPFDRRKEFFLELWRRHGIAVNLRGSHWERVLSTDEYRGLNAAGPVYGADYRETIWRTRISIGLVSHGNRDEYTTRSFDIPACAGFLLAERTAGHRSAYREGEEVALFADPAECARQIRHYLPLVEERARIATAGRARAVQSGYSNDGRLAKLIAELENPDAAAPS